MITKFDSLYAGHIDMENCGYGGTAVNDRSYPDELLGAAMDKAVPTLPSASTAKATTPSGWPSTTSSPRATSACRTSSSSPSTLPMSPAASASPRLRLQHHAHVAPPAPRRGLRDGRLPHGRAPDFRRRPRLPHARGGDVGAPLLDQAGNRDMFEEQVEIILKAFRERSHFSHHGKYYDIPSGGALPRLRAEGNSAGATTAAAAGGMLAADPGRDAARRSTSSAQRRPQGHHWRRRRRGRRPPIAS